MSKKAAMNLERSLRRGKENLFGKTADFVRTIEIDLDHLRPNPDQPRQRFSEASLRELADSIQQHGLINPITVTPDPERGDDHYLVVAGERRYRAFQLLQRTAISAIVTSGNPDEIALIENIQREDLNPLEEAEALERLSARYKYTQQELGQVVGKARTTVNEILKLTSLPEEIKAWCRTSDTPRSVLLELTRAPDQAAQFALWEALKDGALTVRQARSRKQGDAPTSRTTRPLKDRILDDTRSLVKRLGRASDEAIAFDDAEHRELLALAKNLQDFIARLDQTE